MKVWGIRVRKHQDQPWKRVKTLTNRKGRWTKENATKTLKKLRKRGYVGHIFEEDLTSYPNDTHYTKHFRKEELRCRCGCIPAQEVDKNLYHTALGLEMMRAELGALAVLSGHRCENRNDMVGGAINSRHLTGEAADLVVPTGMQDEYAEAAVNVGVFRNGGIGVYKHGGVHVDHRPYIARWNSFVR